MIRNDNSVVVEHVREINAAAKGRMLNGFLRSDRAAMEMITGHPYPK